MKLPVNRGKKKDIFLINRAGISSGDELLVLQLSHDCLWLQHVSVPGSHCSPGHGCQLEMAVPWAGGCRLGLQHRGAFLSFLPPVLLQKHKSTLKKKKKKRQSISVHPVLITDRCLFGPVMVLVSFFFHI